MEASNYLTMLTGMPTKIIRISEFNMELEKEAYVLLLIIIIIIIIIT